MHSLISQPVNGLSVDVEDWFQVQAFAGLIGVSLATLRSWELGQRRPSGPAVVLFWMSPI